MPNISKDRNFDDLAERFEERVYGGAKGELRLRLLKEDLTAILPSDERKLEVLDAGCGFAQISLWLAGLGHQITGCDISEKMLEQARRVFADQKQSGAFIQGAFQDLLTDLPEFDLILNHAVLEWLAEPFVGLQSLMDKVGSGSYLSLMFYNRNSMVYKNVLRGQWRLKPIIEDAYLGKGNRLSPPNPLFPHEVMDRLIENNFEILRHTGIRVFSDYLPDQAMQETDPEELMLLEEKYCRLPAYRDMGRYVHLLVKKPWA
jgi:S-adenosylmethionine-dependent methyltransferase